MSEAPAPRVPAPRSRRKRWRAIRAHVAYEAACVLAEDAIETFTALRVGYGLAVARRLRWNAGVTAPPAPGDPGGGDPPPDPEPPPPPPPPPTGDQWHGWRTSARLPTGITQHATTGAFEGTSVPFRWAPPADTAANRAAGRVVIVTFTSNMISNRSALLAACAAPMPTGGTGPGRHIKVVTNSYAVQGLTTFPVVAVSVDGVAEYTFISPSDLSGLTNGVRVSRAWFATKALRFYTSSGTNESAVRFGDYCHHYAFKGVEVTLLPSLYSAMTSSPVLSTLLAAESSSSRTMSRNPHHLHWQHCWIHGNTHTMLRHAMALEADWWSLEDTIVEDAHEVGSGESKAVAVQNSIGPHKILNCYIEGAGENYMTGGADPGAVFNVLSGWHVIGVSADKQTLTVEEAPRENGKTNTVERSRTGGIDPWVGSSIAILPYSLQPTNVRANRAAWRTVVSTTADATGTKTAAITLDEPFEVDLKMFDASLPYKTDGSPYNTYPRVGVVRAIDQEYLDRKGFNPEDIEIRRSHFHKPYAWNVDHPAFYTTQSAQIIRGNLTATAVSDTALTVTSTSSFSSSSTAYNHKYMRVVAVSPDGAQVRVSRATGHTRPVTSPPTATLALTGGWTALGVAVAAPPLGWTYRVVRSWHTKNNLELKKGRRVLIERCVFEHYFYTDLQNSIANFKSVSQANSLYNDGGPYSTTGDFLSQVCDVTIVGCAFLGTPNGPVVVRGVAQGGWGTTVLPLIRFDVAHCWLGRIKPPYADTSGVSGSGRPWQLNGHRSDAADGATHEVALGVIYTVAENAPGGGPVDVKIQHGISDAPYAAVNYEAGTGSPPLHRFTYRYNIAGLGTYAFRWSGGAEVADVTLSPNVLYGRTSGYDSDIRLATRADVKWASVTVDAENPTLLAGSPARAGYHATKKVPGGYDFGPNVPLLLDAQLRAVRGY